VEIAVNYQYRRFDKQIAGRFIKYLLKRIITLAPMMLPASFLWSRRKFMIDPLHIPPELNGSIGTLKFRSNLDENSITVGLKDFRAWNLDTLQFQISDTLIHFIEPDGKLVGIRICACQCTQSGSHHK
jgi:hypothetical protein